MPWPILILGHTLGPLCRGGLLLHARCFVSMQVCGQKEVHAADRWKRKPGLRPTDTDWGHCIRPQSTIYFYKETAPSCCQTRGALWMGLGQWRALC